MLDFAVPLNDALAASAGVDSVYWRIVFSLILVGVGLAMLDEPEDEKGCGSNPVAHLDAVNDILSFGIFSALSGSPHPTGSNDSVKPTSIDTSSSWLARIGVWDHSIGEQLYRRAQNSAQRHAATIITETGDEATWAALPVIVILFHLLTKWGSNDIIGNCCELFSDALMCAIIELGLKACVRRDRPAYAKQATFYIMPGEWWSFPSGHAMRGAFLARLVCSDDVYLRSALFGSDSGALVYLPWLVYPWAALVAWSRVVKGRHSPCDVMVGLLIGLLVAMLQIRAGPSLWCALKFAGGCVCHVEFSVMCFRKDLRLEGFKVLGLLLIIWWNMQPWGIGLQVSYAYLIVSIVTTTAVSYLIGLHWPLPAQAS